MYVKDHINEFLKSLSGNIKQPIYSMILSALYKNYGVFHIEIGTDTDGIPYAEMGIAAPSPINLYQSISVSAGCIWDHIEFGDTVLEGGIMPDQIRDYSDNHLLPIVSTDVSIPEEISSLMILDMTEDPNVVDSELWVDVQYCTNVELSEMIIRCTYDPTKYKELTFECTRMESWVTEEYLGLYLACWMTLQLPFIIPERSDG